MKKFVWLLVVILIVLIGGVYYFTKDNGAQSIQITSPQSGDVLQVGSTSTIKWISKNVPSTNKITITIRRVPPPPLQSEGQEFDPIIFVGLPNTGSTEWVISDSYPNGKYILGITSYVSLPVTNPITAESKEFSISKEVLVGNDRDAHGCIGSAGYSYCEAKASCIRVWESYCTSATPKTVTFQCDSSKSILATFYPKDDKFVDLKLSDERNMSIPRAISASGARYAKADESFVFWNKGDTALITEGASSTETYSNCIIK